MCIFRTGDSGNGWIIILSVYIEPEAQSSERKHLDGQFVGERASYVISLKHKVD